MCDFVLDREFFWCGRHCPGVVPSQWLKIRLYGSQFELVGDPFAISEDVVLVDAVERKSGESCRARIPLNIVKMAIDQGLHAA